MNENDELPPPPDDAETERNWLAENDADVTTSIVKASPDLPTEWRRDLMMVHKINNKTKEEVTFTASTRENAVIILRAHESWRPAETKLSDGTPVAMKQLIAYDAFEECIVKTRIPPWCESNGHFEYNAPAEHTRVWTDSDTARCANWLSRHEGVTIATEKIEQAVTIAAEANIIHPVRDYLNALVWDGKQRLPTWLNDYLGVPESVYASAVGVRWLISAVARVMRPGCQVDCTLLIEGPQGLGKTSALRALVPERAWYADSGINMGDKDSYQNLRGVWIYGLDELDSLRRSDMTRTKNFLTQTFDRYRPSYGRRAVSFLRQNVFAGTTNDEEYLSDRTGNRRFWPVKAGVISVKALTEIRDQLWAEAKARFDSSEAWYVDTAELRVLCQDQTTSRSTHDPWIDLALEWLKAPTKHGDDGNPEIFHVEHGVATADFLVHCIKMRMGDITVASNMRAADVLRHVGFNVRKQFRKNGALTRAYFRPVDA